jgi:hypothetical protein
VGQHFDDIKIQSDISQQTSPVYLPQQLLKYTDTQKDFLKNKMKVDILHSMPKRSFNFEAVNLPVRDITLQEYYVMIHLMQKHNYDEESKRYSSS